MCFADVDVDVFCRCVFQVLQDLQVTVVIHLGDLCSRPLVHALVHSSCKVHVHVRAFEESKSTGTHTCTSRFAIQVSGPLKSACTPTCASTDTATSASTCTPTTTCTDIQAPQVRDRFSKQAPQGLDDDKAHAHRQGLLCAGPFKNAGASDEHVKQVL